MFPTPTSMVNNWNKDYYTVDIGNYGYGIYSQDVAFHRDPFTGRTSIERDIDFVPLSNSSFGPYASYPAAVHQHYHRYE